jgi:hypothetical protein
MIWWEGIKNRRIIWWRNYEHKARKEVTCFKYVVVSEMMMLCLRINFYQNELKHKKNIDGLII